MDYMLPNVRVARASARLIDNTARFISSLSGATRTYSRPGDRWGFRIDYASLWGTDRARIETLIAAQRGAANRVVFAPPGHITRGAFPYAELVPNPRFRDTTIWAGVNCSLYAADNLMWLRNSGAAAAQLRSNLITLTVGAAYLVRVVVQPGNQSTWTVAGGTIAGGTDVFTANASDGGLISVSFIATSANFYLTILNGTAVLGDYVYVSYVSLARCALVNGGNQSGSGLSITKFPANTNGILLPGDWIGVGQELKRVLAPINSDASGTAVVTFSPPLRAVPNDQSAVAISAPLGRFYLSPQENSWEVAPGLYTSTTLDFVEAP